MQLQEKKPEFEKLIERKEYYEIRLESIGGLGANLLGKMLGELGLKYLGVNSSSFSSYGSEKTGTPVKGYVRYGKQEREIRVHSPIVTPDLLVVFHQALCKEENVWKGCHKDTKVLIALETGQDMAQISPKEDRVHNRTQDENSKKEERDNLGGFYGIEAQKIAIRTKSRINVVLLGAILKIMGLDSTEVGEQICKDTLGKKYPQSLENNLEGLRQGFEEVKCMEEFVFTHEDKRSKERKNRENTICKIGTTPKADVQELGYLNAPVGGINVNFGSTVTNDLSPSRQGYIPLFLKEKCINCGLCFSACPDMVFQFAKGKYKGKDMMINQGLDYYHCKGCLRCVDVCPVNALVMAEEAAQEKKTHFMPNQELLRLPKYYEKSGADGYITSESYLTEVRMEGGEV